MTKKILEKKYKKALDLLETATEWACEIVSYDQNTMKEESPTMAYVCKEYEKLTS